MTTLIISDLHLSPAHPELVKLFLSFMETQAVNAERLYILGDLFEHWIGDDDENTTINIVIDALRRLTLSGIPVYFMHGNRDFLIGKNFLKKTGCELLSDPTVIDLYGKKTLLTHGDAFCINDTAYLIFRKIIRNTFIKSIYLALPLWLRRIIAKIIRATSPRNIEKKPNNQSERYDIPQSEMNRLATNYSVDQIIHGHTHRPSIHHFLLDGHWVNHIVLSDWHKEGNVLICDPHGETRLVYF
ncbi:MAG: UDP-2,3-diacylglucosamine diphosphatase [Proteobacteria bacterium]|nr:UDP-2,3-diacylglucosamine diphosphatase [Pseudomonadota bacterium]